MSVCQALQIEVFEDNSAFVMARIEGHLGTNITQASMSAISALVYDVQNSNALVATLTPSIPATVFDSLQTADPRWKTDAVGYNFGYMIPGSSFPDGGKLYLVKFVFTPTSGDPFNFRAKVTTVELPGQ